MKNIKSKRKMSALEKLPTELLEKVFLFAMNIGLALASPVIGGKCKFKAFLEIPYSPLILFLCFFLQFPPLLIWQY